MTSTTTSRAATAAEDGDAPDRLPELDMARGVALVAVGLVLMVPTADALTGGTAVPGWVGPSEWSGITLADLLPALFATLVGVSLAMQQRRHEGRTWPWWVARTGRRVAVLLAVGLVLTWATGPSVDLPPNPDALRWTGHLARLGAAAAIAIPLVRLPRWTEVGVASLLLVGHTAWLTSFGTWDPAGTPLRGADAALLGPARVAGELDPTGLVAVAPTLVCILAGFWIGEWIGDRDRSAATAGVLVLVGAWTALLGVSWSQLVPANATLWTGPILALGVAAALGLLGVGHLLTRRAGTDALVAHVTPLGANALVAYVLLVLAGRWVAGSAPYASVVSTLAGLLTPVVAVAVSAGAVVFVVARGVTALSDRGVRLRA